MEIRQEKSINFLLVQNIKHTNNTTAVSVASDGRTTFTTQPQITTPICFQASRIDSGGTGKQGTIIFNTTYVNLGGGYDSSTGKFTVTSATTGYYYIYAGVKFNVLTANRIQLRIIYYNGSSATTFALTELQFSQSGYAAPTLGVVVPLLSNGDYVYTEAYQNSGGSIGLSNEVEGTFFGGFKIG